MEGYWDTQTIDGYWDTQRVDGYFETQTIDGYYEDVWVDGYWTLEWDTWSVEVFVPGHWEGEWTWISHEVLGDWNWSGWSPDASTVLEGMTFTQTRTGVRSRVAWETNEAGDVRHFVSGPNFTDEQRSVTGTKPFTWTAFSEPGPWAYPAWSPDPGSVACGQSFGQTRTPTRDVRTGERNELGGERNIAITPQNGQQESQQATGTQACGGGSGGGGGGGGGPTAVPAITSAATALGAVGASFSYQIVASNSPTSYAATGLPSELALGTTSGLISGTPTSPGSFNVTLTATNAIGTSAPKTLTISVLPSDTSPPIAPVSLGLALGALSSTGFGVTWIPYTDNAGMAAGYPSFGITYVASLVNTAHVATTSSPAARFNNLTPGATYTVRIMARDLSGNETGWNPQTLDVTLPASDPVTTASTWADVDGDGLRDELIAEGAASYDFNSFPAETSHEFVSTVTMNWPVYFWWGILTPDQDLSWTYYLSGRWQPLIEFNTYEIELVRPGYQFRTEPGYEYSVVSKLTLQNGSTVYATLIPRTEFVPASTLASAIQQEVLLGSMIPVDMLNYSPLRLARIAKPAAGVQVNLPIIGNVTLRASAGGSRARSSSPATSRSPPATARPPSPRRARAPCPSTVAALLRAASAASPAATC
ncbi:MAG: Ig domain-containing protein [Opitutaceae bacterium]